MHGLAESEENKVRLRNYCSRFGGEDIRECYWDKQHYAFIVIFASNKR